MEISLKIKKEDVMQEVAVTTAYTGGKMDTDATAMLRIPTVDEDESHLERFWEECRADLCQELIGLVAFEGIVRDFLRPVNPSLSGISETIAVTPPSIQSNQHYEVRLNVSKSFDEALLPSMQLSLFSYFVQGITAKWYVYTNKKEAGEYSDKATTFLDDIHRKAVYKKKPTRPTYDD